LKSPPSVGPIAKSDEDTGIVARISPKDTRRLLTLIFVVLSSGVVGNGAAEIIKRIINKLVE
jgi:hypothetical protein